MPSAPAPHQTEPVIPIPGRRPIGPNPKEFGNLVTQLVLNLRTQSSSVGEATKIVCDSLSVTGDAVYKWRQGRAMPANFESYRRLAELGKERAKLDRAWALNLLVAGGIPEPETVLAQVYGSAPGSEALAVVAHNLPRRVPHFTGREDDLWQLARFLSPGDERGCLGVYGPAGVGKTAVVNELAWRLVSQPNLGETAGHFDRIVWITARQQRLVVRSGAFTCEWVGENIRSLEDLEDVLRILSPQPDTSPDKPQQSITANDPRESIQRLRACFEPHERTLLILDGLAYPGDTSSHAPSKAPHEAANTVQRAAQASTFAQVMLFLTSYLPPNCKVLVTARADLDLPGALRLAPLNEESMRSLIEAEATDLDIALDEDDLHTLQRASDGTPQIALLLTHIYAAERTALDDILAHLDQYGGATAHEFFYGASYADLRTSPGEENRSWEELVRLLAFYPPTWGATAETLTDILRRAARAKLKPPTDEEKREQYKAERQARLRSFMLLVDGASADTNTDATNRENTAAPILPDPRNSPARKLRKHLHTLAELSVEGCVEALQPLLRLGLVYRRQARPDDPPRYILPPLAAISLEIPSAQGEDLSAQGEHQSEEARPAEQDVITESDLRAQWIAHYRDLACPPGWQTGPRLAVPSGSPSARPAESALTEADLMARIASAWEELLCVCEWCADNAQSFDLAFFWVGRLALSISDRANIHLGLAPLAAVPEGGALGAYAEAHGKVHDQERFLLDLVVLAETLAGTASPSLLWAAQLKLADLHARQPDATDRTRAREYLELLDLDDAFKGMGIPFRLCLQEVSARLAIDSGAQHSSQTEVIAQQR